jgi:hypothetical protein
MALTDARPFENPFVGGIKHVFQVFIGDSALGKIMAYGSYFCATRACAQGSEI